MTNELENITPDGSVAPVFLDPTPPTPSDDMLNPIADAAAQLEARNAAVEKLMTEFGFTEEMARAVVGG